MHVDHSNACESIGEVENFCDLGSFISEDGEAICNLRAVFRKRTGFNLVKQRVELGLNEITK